MSFRLAAATSLLFFTLAGMGATPALAQHVVTDNEAGKLTLDALTATPAPLVHRVAYRTMSRRSIYLPTVSRMRAGSTSAVRTVTYRHVEHVSNTGRASARHGKTRRG